MAHVFVGTLAQPAVGCISHHTLDVRPCTNSVRDALRLPEVKDQELALARQMHVDAIDPTFWFCTPQRCPVIVHDLILYRDNAHMTPPWSQFISPLLADPILSAMRTSTASGR